MSRTLSIPMLGALCLGLLLGGLIVALWPRSAPPAPPKVTCRPSHPPQALSGATEPVVLFWGNSLLFDHSWDHSSFDPVNCAQQGLTLTAALPAIPDLPKMPVDAILLAFGSVELIRPHPIDTDLWAQDMDTMLTALRARYPRARILAVSIPTSSHSNPPWTYAERPELAVMNSALYSMLETDFLDLSAALDTADLIRQTYDGVHLTRQSYKVWETMLARRVHR